MRRVSRTEAAFVATMKWMLAIASVMTIITLALMFL